MQNETEINHKQKENSADAKTAIVTGASSGIGNAISNVLLEMGYEVYGFGRHFQEDVFQKKTEKEMMCEKNNFDESCFDENQFHQNNYDKKMFHAIVCDLTNTAEMLSHIGKIRKRKKISVLVNNAGTGYYGLHETLNPGKIQEMVRVNLEAPMILTNVLLRDLKKAHGTIINISSVTAQQRNPHGCTYGATKAGLSSFAKSLFDEVRKYGVKVITIQPDMTKTSLYRHADFREGIEEESFLTPEEIANAVKMALKMREGAVMTEITLRPQIHRIRKISTLHNE